MRGPARQHQDCRRYLRYCVLRPFDDTAHGGAGGEAVAADGGAEREVAMGDGKRGDARTSSNPRSNGGHAAAGKIILGVYVSEIP
jgi:hypothetical protein